MKFVICYLNTDLDLISRRDLNGLTSALVSRGLCPLEVSQSSDGNWRARLETEEEFHDLDPNLSAMLTAIESLESESKTRWFECTTREFNIGYDCGNEPWEFNQGITPATLARIPACGASLR